MLKLMFSFLLWRLNDPVTTWAEVLWNWECVLRNWLAHSYSLFSRLSPSEPYISLKFPTREMSTASLYQLEISPYPISMASPGENLEMGPWNKWQGLALNNLRYVYWVGGWFPTMDCGFWCRADNKTVWEWIRLHMSNQLSRKLPWGASQANHQCLNWTSHLPPTFLLPNPMGV